MEVAQEIELEATLHVTTFTAGQCMEMYGSAPDVSAGSDESNILELKDSPAPSPSIPEVEHRLMMLREFSTGNGERKDLAACLATPAEPVEEENAAHRSRQAAASQRTSS
jgi:hypothetical protein